MSVFPEEPFGSADALDLPPAALAVVRRTGLRLGDLGAVFDPAYGALGRAAASGRIALSGPALAIYRGDPMDVFDLEIGYPVDTALSETVAVDGIDIEASELPSGPAVASTFIGSYDGLGEAWGRLFGAVSAEGRRPAGIWIEAYVSDPRTTAPEELRTDLVIPVMR